MPSVFISYSHDSDAHRDFVRGIADRLRQEGVDCLIDQYINGFPEQGWQRWMEDQIETADFVLLVCTETYLRRFRGHETQGGKGVNFEGVVISQALYDSYYKNTKFIPTVPNNGSFEHVPVPLKPYSTYRLDDQYEDVYRIITGQAKYQPPDLGAIRPLPSSQTKVPHKIYSDDLPTVEGKLFGRKEELTLLDWAFAGTKDTPLPQPLPPQGREGTKAPTIVQFVASGGTGKTKLIRTWLDENTDQIDGLIAWSFYSQGSSEDKQISATPFFMQALKSLDSDKDISDFNTEEEKGEHIADLLRERRCLLVLDGLEPLQQVGRGMRGELKDRAIRKLLRCLVGNHSSLCIITTRLPVHELKDRRQVVQHDLQNLAPEDGVALLRSFGVSGRDADMLAAVEEYGRHALALHLLGNALATYLDGDVRKRDTLGELIGDYDDVERHAFKVMQAYEHWLEGTVELKLLYLLGLFDHPVEQEVLAILWEAEIPGLTEGVERKAWLVAQRDLIFRYRMMAETPSPQPLSLTGRGAKDNTFDCHPLIREYFGRRLKENDGEIWRQAHTVLYEYYKGLPEKLWRKNLPDTLEEMQPLFHAVSHGCAAELYELVFLETYFPRILREEERYIQTKLGAYNENLATLSHFFIKLWKALAVDLTKFWQSMILNWISFDLRALGRLSEALEPMQIGLKIAIAESRHQDAAGQANNISELKLLLGDVAGACLTGQRSVAYADQSGDLYIRLATRTAQGEALTQAGYVEPAYILFIEAEKLQQQRQQYIPFLYSLYGFRYCDLLLELRDTTGAFKRAKKIYSECPPSTLLDAALYQLLFARTYFQLFKNNTNSPKHTSKIYLKEKTIHWLNLAVTSLRISGSLHHLPKGLLARFAYNLYDCNFSHAYQDLIETYEITPSSGMRLHLTDYHLEMARLILAVEADPAQYPEATPDREQRTLPFADQEEPSILTLEGHITEADRLIQETGYHRRDAELAELKQALDKS